MKYFKFKRSSVTLLICLIVVTISSIFMYNLLGSLLGGVSIYLLLRSTAFERVVELGEIENERLRRIVHLLLMRLKNGEN